MKRLRLAGAVTSVSVTVAVIAACGGQAPRAPAPPPSAPPADPPALATMAQACVRVVSCSRAADPRFRDPSACVDWWLSDSDPKEPLRKCLADARGCEQVSACLLGGGDARAASFCAGKQGVVSGCDGDRLVSCGDDDAHEGTVVDCAAMGASCREVKSAAGIVVRACWSPQKCPAGAPESRCDGGAVITCQNGAFERIPCRPGTTCEERRDESGEVTASCELPGRRRCDLRGSRYCENDRLIECARSGPTSTPLVTDCAGFGLRCTGVGPRAGCTVPNRVECDKDQLARCDGSSVVFCAAGRVATISCESIGLGTCNPAAKGPIAACVPKAPPAAAAPAPPSK